MEPVPEIEIGQYLQLKNWWMATAESCTGGLVAHRLTNIPGSSHYFLGGVVAYDNQVKTALLHVPAELLAEFGAVSEETVRAMADGARRIFNADLAVSISGVAGPGGGSIEKPVGTTWVAVACERRTWARKHLFLGDREQNKAGAAEAALMMVLQTLRDETAGGDE